MKHVHAALFALLCVGFAAPAYAQDDDRFSITPYIWLPTFDADIGFNPPAIGAGAPDVSVGPVDWLENLNGAFMLSGEARFRPFSVFGDFIYLKLENEDALVRDINGPGPIGIPIDAGSEASLSGTLFTLAAGYDAVDDEHWRVQPFIGVRYLGIDADLDWRLQGPLGLFPQQGSVSRDEDVVDVIIGVRGEMRTGGPWSFPYYFDIGGGDSDTRQASVGVAYAFGWGDLHLDYRYLNYQQESGDLLQELSLDGPSFGATFRF